MSNIEILFVAVLVGLVFGLSGEVLIGRAERKELRYKVAVRNAALDIADKRVAGLENETAALIAQLSQAKNTLALATAEAKGPKEPIKAKSAAEVRAAVERINLEESEKDV